MNPDCVDSTTSGKMSEQERLELATRLDRELDEFIAGLEKRKTHEAWPEDRWEEEMEKHPFFMSKPPADGEPLPPLLEGLQQLKYSSTDNSSEELASNYKDDGNFNFKHKNYRMAVISYTEGIRQKCSDDNLNAQLFNNRAACHFMLKNFRSSYEDCCKAISLDKNYEKALVRRAQCLFELGKLQECVDACDKLEKRFPKSAKILNELSTKAASAIAVEKQKKRQEKISQLHTILIKNRIADAIKARGIHFIDKGVEDWESPVLNAKVTINAEERLSWPVAFLYPEYKTSDLIEQFHEDSIFAEQLAEVFSETPEWDVDAKYKPESISIYYEDAEGKIHSVDTQSTLGSAISQPDFRVDKWTPVFLLLVKDSRAEKNFLITYK